MKERPILFSTEMIQAIQKGKTQTRRLLKPRTTKCPYGKPDDRLWVRETWTALYEIKLGEFDRDIPYYHHEIAPDERKNALSVDYLYRANGDFTEHDREEDGAKWQPNIFMPRAACRFILNIKSIRVERLNAISEADAQAEGVASVAEYKALWEQINGVGSWDANPWVWVVEFEVA